MDYDAIILGAGGAGLMAAATAGQAGANILVLDHADRPGKKILISGGGRCNFTNRETEPGGFLSQNPHFAKSALKRSTPWDFLALVEAHGIAWHEKTLGQLFCDGSASQIVAMLLAECEKALAQGGRVDLRLSTQIGEITHTDGRFHVGNASARNLVIATGGPSIPKMGATGIAYEIAKRFGLKVIPPRPALVPFTLGPEEMLFREISGVACPVVARARDKAFAEAALFTHKGLSGPAILQISSYWTKGDTIALTVLEGAAEKLRDARRRMPRAYLKAALAEHLPNRLAEALATRIGLQNPHDRSPGRSPGRPLADTPDRDLDRAAEILQNLTFRPTGTEGFAKAEVTAGGIDTNALSSKTMEARTIPGLYAVGEAVDVTGWLGGYNFQWAWSSGVAAGRAIGAGRG